ncbi:MAG: hypothetical protein DRO99_00605, partial [Candidatus Aenigmatarchaeota archaeon]
PIYVRHPKFNWTNATDPDNDPLTYILNITCFNTTPIAGSCSDDNRIISGIADSNYTLQGKLKYFQRDNYYYNWSVKANDGELNSSSSEVWNITLFSVVMLSLNQEELDFGSMNQGDADDTTDDDPTPFILQNDGNCMNDVNMSASMLWTLIQYPSDYYMFKADNETGSPNYLNVNWTNSTYDWAQVPENGTKFLDYFNWSNATDSVEVDISVEVPAGEPSGERSSTITMTGWYVKEV